MERKKWTPKAAITAEILKFREKRKWQLALRRYILEKKASAAYAPYFGLDVEGFREWIELQFTKGLNWDNFGGAWQFEHIVQVNFFDFSIQEDLLLCWNFINIRVEKLQENASGIGTFAVKPYFESLYNKTGHGLCLKMLEKISQFELSKSLSNPAIEQFIIDNKDRIASLSTFGQYEFAKINQGIPLTDILMEREILKKFASN